MDIQIHNTLSRKKETFTPIKKGTVTMYSCGPTVYDTPHVGNFRTCVMNDLVRRTFEYNGYKVEQTMNITDVDDKTIKRSRTEGVALEEVTHRYEKLFFESLNSLNILPPTHVTRATEYIDAMIALVQGLLEKDIAYKAADGIYLRIDRVKNYGQLAGLKDIIKHESPARQDLNTADEYDKENVRDFAIWKFKSPEDGDISWKASFGEGRPGWHIECSAMAMKTLGETIDVHTGGSDLIFPHHTNEIAQSESATGKTFVHYWIHGGFMTMHSEKMAKSKGNVSKLEDLHEEQRAPLSFRYWLLTAHYRAQIDFTVGAVHAAQQALIRLMNIVSRYPEKGGVIIPAYQIRFNTHINNDFDMPGAVALLWELVKDAKQSATDIYATILDFDRVFGLKLSEVPRVAEDIIPAHVTALAEAREDARKEKDWAKADAFRQAIEAEGYDVSDTDTGFAIKKQGLTL